MRRSDGFTLLEVLAATAIVGIALTVIIQLFAANLRNIARSEGYTTAVVRAEEKMRSIISQGDFTDRTWMEQYDNGSWIDCSINDTLKERSEGMPVAMKEIITTIHWKDGLTVKTLTLRTLKLDTLGQ